MLLENAAWTADDCQKVPHESTASPEAFGFDRVPPMILNVELLLEAMDSKVGIFLLLL